MSMSQFAHVVDALEYLRDHAHRNSKEKGFWGEEGSTWNFGEKIALIHSELSEMFEAWRKDIKETEKEIYVADPTCRTDEDTIGMRKMTAIEEEMADCFIRLLDLCGKLDIDVGRVVMSKMAYNAGRPHMHGGRKC